MEYRKCDSKAKAKIIQGEGNHSKFEYLSLAIRYSNIYYTTFIFFPKHDQIFL